jgi:hypothetical protein
MSNITECPTIDNTNSGSTAAEVQVPLYSRFVFPDITLDEGEDIGAAIVAVRASLGAGTAANFQVTASASERVIRIKPVRDFPGRARLPAGIEASPQSEWRALVCLPGQGGEGEGDREVEEKELPAEQSELSASEIVDQGGRVVVVIPVSFQAAAEVAQLLE